MIGVNNLTRNSIDEEFVRQIIQKVLDGEDVKEEIELSVAFIGSGKMRGLNKKYRGKNRVTDVLAFPESKIIFEKFRIGPFKKVKGLGEIVICTREVEKDARRLKRSFKQELSRVLIHGLLHLLGYDHQKGEKKAKEMEKKQEQYLLKVLK